MKTKLLIITVCLFAFYNANAQFITKWKTNNSGLSANNQITIPASGTGPYNYTVYWGDGTYNPNVTTGIIHTYASEGIYTVSIFGNYPHMRFNNGGDKRKLLSVEKWGDQVWSSMEESFYGCTNLVINASDTPNLSQVTSFKHIFTNATFMNQGINTWDVSNVTDMSYAFSGASSFNQDLSAWNVSNVTNMVHMFRLATNFNQDLNTWNVSNVIQIASMFNGATSFNGDISAWNVSSVTNMHSMFSDAISFNRDLSAWNVSNVTVMYNMFNQASSFNQNLSTWDVSNVESMSFMFKGASSFDQDLGNWDISSITSMINMFDAAELSIDNYDSTLIGWNSLDVSEAQIPENITFNGGNSKYSIGETARTNLMSTPYNWTITDAGIDLSSVFITTWKTDNTGISNDSSITIPIASTGTYNYDVDWGDGQVDLNVTNSITHDYATAGTYQVKITGDFPQIYFNNTGDRQKILSVEQWGNNPWSSMQGAFHGCSNLVINATDNPNLSNVSDMSFMFTFCSSFNEDISSWDVSNVTNMAHTFRNTAAYNQDIGAWNVSNVTSMTSMFWNANVFNQDISGWDVSSVTDMSLMFRSADTFNQDIGAWDVRNVTAMNLMFAGALSFDQNLGNWDISSVSNMNTMFFANSLSVSNYDATLIGWSTLDTGETQIPENITFSGGNSKYCAGESARTNLMSTPYDWTITDGGIDCSQAFITTWETTTANQTITIPTTGTGYNYYIDWDNDGVFDDLSVSGDAMHTYAVAGTHTVTITGNFPRIYFNNTGDRQKILSVEQWGNNPWSSMSSAFHGCSNLVINATDNPDLSNVSDMSFMFTFCSSFNEDISSWDVSNVTNMAHTFRNTAAYNQDIGGWDVSNVTSMTSMFWNANVFNQDISFWDVSSVTDMSLMFRSADTFNQDIGAWDVSNVTAMNLMFAGALSFDQNLGNWDISSVSNMNTMFFSNSLSVSNYDATLIGWSTLDTGETQIPENITFSGGNSSYCTGESARTNLMSTPYDWTITDGGLNCDTLGVNEEIFQGLSMFPNPVKSEVTILLQDNASYMLLDMNGRLIEKGELLQGEAVLNLSKLSKGLYLLQLSSNNQTITKKIIKD